jgi:hypothetical protein
MIHLTIQKARIIERAFFDQYRLRNRGNADHLVLMTLE